MYVCVYFIDIYTTDICVYQMYMYHIHMYNIYNYKMKTPIWDSLSLKPNSFFKNFLEHIKILSELSS